MGSPAVLWGVPLEWGDGSTEPIQPLCLTPSPHGLLRPSMPIPLALPISLGFARVVVCVWEAACPPSSPAQGGSSKRGIASVSYKNS
jgi:hypothetical protein